MEMNWRQLLLVVLVAAIVGGASGFIGNQVSATWTSVTPQVIRLIPSNDMLSPDWFERRERDRQHREMQRQIDCVGRGQSRLLC